MGEDRSITKWFGDNLAELLSGKIEEVTQSFDREGYIRAVREQCPGLGYSGRIALHAKELKNALPADYSEALEILLSILGEENPGETGMFSEYYWIMPVGKFIETYGLEHFEESMRAIEEVTKRNTGEYAIRPFLRKYPLETIRVMRGWALSDNFHLRRLAAEGIRPKLPWATRLETFIDEPEPVFGILALLMEEGVRFVQKSVANNIADYLKVNPSAARAFIDRYRESGDPNTRWILKYAIRKSDMAI